MTQRLPAVCSFAIEIQEHQLQALGWSADLQLA
jgi:hypothetical protein